MCRLSRILRAILITIGICLSYTKVYAQPPTLHIPRVSRAPKLEDFLNNVPRESETKLTGFRQFFPHDGAPVSQPTSAYLSYDDKNIYAVFVCVDDPDKIRARMANRENVFSDDLVRLTIDTFRDNQHAYSFGVNPLGVQTEHIITEGQRPNLSFDTLWYSRGRLTPQGFIVWMAIPFKSIRFSNDSVQTWGIALSRVIIRNNEFSYWPYITPRVTGFVQQLATLEGITHVSPGRNMQLIPYGTFAGGRFLDSTGKDGPEFKSKSEARGGLDAKMVLRDALTLDLTLNPDFSQVESDEPQVTINQRFEVFFPEKRPFFIENAGIFQMPENLFFSRRIVDPQFGVRLTGKLGRWTIGGIAIDDRAPGKLLPESDPSHEKRAGIGVVRVQREFARQSNVGLLLTDRNFASSFNRVVSLDTRLKLNQNWVFSGQISGSHSKELDGAKLSGPAYFAELLHSGRHFNYVTRYLDRAPSFRSALGFIPRVDVRQIEQVGSYRWLPEHRRVISFGPSGSMLLNWNRSGRVQDWLISSVFGIDFIRQTSLLLEHTKSSELFRDREFRKSRTGITLSTEWFKWLSISGFYFNGTGINFFPAAGLTPFLASSNDARINLTLRPTSQVRFDQTYIYSRLSSRNESHLPGVLASTPIFNNHILRSRLNYQFNRELSLRAIVDYKAVLPNTSLVALSRAKRLTGDLLVTYLLNPGTALYVGYTDNYENLSLDPTTPPTLHRTASPATSIGRQFFVKMSYLLRF